MKTLASIFILLLTGFLAASQPADEVQIRQLISAQQSDWNKGDIPAFMQAYWKSDSLLFTGANGPTRGWQKTLDNYLQRYDSPAKMGKLQFTLLQLTPLGDMHYMVLGQWHLKREVGDVGGYFTLILRKIGGQWKIIADHTS